MNSYLHDVRDFGATGDGVSNDAGAFRLAIHQATASAGKVVASGRFRVEGTLNVTCDCDFSQATLLIDRATINIAYTNDYLNAHQKVFTPLDKSRMTNLQSSLQGILDSATLEAFEHSWVRINGDGTNAIHVYRADSSSPEQKKASVSLLGKYGRLAYSLNHDYTDVETVNIRLRRLPEKRLVFVCPVLEIVNYPTGNYLLRVFRDLVTVVDFTLNHQAPDPATDTYFGLVGIHDGYDIVFESPGTPGFGTTNNEPGVPQKVRYDINLGTALKVRLDNINSVTGWKTVDGNSFRDLRISNSNLYGLHAHFNAADITLDHCRIHSGGISIGTGATDATLTVRNTVFTSKPGGAVSMRPDYGELRGRILIENCQLCMSSLTEETRTATILSLVDSAIRVRDQPSRYALPASVVIRNVHVLCKRDCSILAINKGVLYNDKRRLAAPLDITVDNVTLESRDNGKLIFDYGFIPWNPTRAAPVSIRLNRLENLSGGDVLVTLTGPAAQKVETFQFSLDIGNVDHLRATLVGGQRSTANLHHCTLHALDTRAGGDAWLKRLSLYQCRFVFEGDFNNGTHLSLSPGIQAALFGNCVFDASPYRAQTGNLLPIQALAHGVEGGMSIDCHGAGNAEPGKGLRVVIPVKGSESCYATGTDGALLPLSG